MLWLQGWNQAPEIARTCLKTWQVHNPDWQINALRASDVGDWLDMADLPPTIRGKDMPPEALSDIVRIALLERYGGIWIDSTVYCLRPLFDWLPPLLGSGFFAFAKPAPDRMLSSWFLAAIKGGYLVQEWHRRTLEYWARHTERHHYFWFHYLFAEAYKQDPYFRKTWDSTPEVSASGPHCYAPYEKLSAPVSPRDLRLIEFPPTPVLKLTHKLPVAEYSHRSVLGHLYAKAETAWQIADFARENPASPTRNLLIAWYGSFDGQGTIGDLLAMQSVATHLVGLGHRVFHASAGDIRILGSQKIEWEEGRHGAFDALVFVCGPILRHHPDTRELFEKFAGIPRIGVGVSLFPAGHFNYMNPFDTALAREGTPDPFDDVAIVAPGRVYRPKPVRKGPPTIGIVLRGRQDEYGPELCLSELTEQIADEAAKDLVKKKGGRIVIIENHLRRSGLPQEGIEGQ